MFQVSFINNRDTKFIDSLHSHLRNSKEAKISVSYIRNSGVNPLIDELERFVNRGGKLSVLTSAQMGITEEEALRSFLDLGANVSVFKESGKKTFHSKGFIFKGDGASAVIVGSANLTHSGIVSGIEWGLEIIDDANISRKIEEEFDDLWRSPDVVRVTFENVDKVITEPSKSFKPLLEIEDGLSIRQFTSLSELQAHHPLYSVHKRPDHFNSWNFNLSVKKVGQLFRSGNLFYVVFYCDCGSDTEMIFAIPSDFLKTNVFPYAHKTHGVRYLINVNKSTLNFNWQRSIKMDGKPFLIQSSV